MSPPGAKSHDWPTIGDVDALDVENVKIMLDRADALLKAQDDGLKAMEARMSSLFGQSITCLCISCSHGYNICDSQSAKQPCLTSMGASVDRAIPHGSFSLAAVVVSVSSMLSQTWSASVIAPHDIYDEAILSAPPNSVRLLICRALQNAIDRNTSAFVAMCIASPGQLAYLPPVPLPLLQ